MVLVLFLSCGLAACQKSGHQGPPILRVTVVHAQVRSMTRYESFLGTVTPLQTVNLVPQTSGMLESFHFRQGGMVRRGQLLFVINPDQAKAALAQARANLEAARASARYNAEQVRQDQPLVQKDFITRQSYEQAVSQSQAAQAQVAADQAAVRQAGLALGYTRIVAPIRGRIGLAQLKPGNLVVANQTLLATINQVSPMGITFQIPQGLLEAVHRAKMEGWAIPVFDEKQGKRLDTARLEIVDNSVSTSTATIRVQAQAANLRARLWPGGFVEVRLPVEHLARATVLPVAAVQQGNAGHFVYEALDGRVETKVVRVLWQNGKDAVVDGFPVGSPAIYPVPARIFAGARVQVVAPEISAETSLSPGPAGDRAGKP